MGADQQGKLPRDGRQAVLRQGPQDLHAAGEARAGQGLLAGHQQRGTQVLPDRRRDARQAVRHPLRHARQGRQAHADPFGAGQEGRGDQSAGTLEADRQAAESLATEGWKLWGQRKLAEAEEKFSQAVKKDPANASAWNGLGWAQQNQGKLADAEQSFRKCLAIDPKQAGALNGLGWIAKMRKDPDKAIGYWQKAVEALPGASAALNGLTTTLVELGRHAEAVKYYEMWLKAEPDNAQVKAGLEKARKAAKAGEKKP